MMHSCKLLSLFLVALLLNISGFNTHCPDPYSSCSVGKPGFINVHLVPHTHDDVGWLKTVDQYYYGSNNGEQKASVQYILDTVVDELLKDPARRFVYVEMAFFWRWWRQQDETRKQLVRMLVNEGRLEFVIGAWCMNDEATTYYSDMIDQQTLGLKFILKEFGECARPRSSWQVDPFGHSREHASLLAQFGFDGLFLGRVDYEDFEARGVNKTREGVWQASANLGDAARIFTGILPNRYSAPPGFCFDEYCGDDPIMDDPNLEDYNVDKKVDDFLDYVKNQQASYKTKNLIMTMGDDFQYSNSHMYFKNIDKMIKYVNERQQNNASNVNIFYSTTACYLYALNKENITWSVKSDDFFPYAHRGHSYWTGYFTSRPTLKYYTRQAGNVLQAARKIGLLANYKDQDNFETLRELERAQGVLQHHDAVAGTERQHVAKDYAKRLYAGIEKGVDFIFNAFGQHLSEPQQARCDLSGGPGFCFCQNLNISECIPTQNSDEMAITAFNPLARNTSTWFRIPVANDNFYVWDIDPMSPIPSQSIQVKQETRSIPERNTTANYELVFRADFEAFGRNVYVVRNTTMLAKEAVPSKSAGNTIGNAQLELKFDNNGDLYEIYNLASNISSKICQNFCFYKSQTGNNSEDIFQASGAYIFRPQSDIPVCLTANKFSIYRCDLFEEIHQVYNEWISQTIRVYKDEKNVEFEWQVGPIDVTDGIGKEVIMRFNSDLKSDALFYTDSNGREMLERRRDYRPTWKLNQTEKVSGNYYPVNSRIYLRDVNAKKQLTLVTDRSQGGASIKDGSLELMLHRRILHDDSLGVSEPLNELGADGKGLVVKGTTHLVFDKIANSGRLHRELSLALNNKPVLFFDPDIQTEKFGGRRGSRGLAELPAQLHLLTFMQEYDEEEEASCLVRIEHIYELGEDQEFSKAVTVDLGEYLSPLIENISGIFELGLGANIPVDELSQRLRWRGGVDYNGGISNKPHASYVYEFKPMQIRTFRVFYH